MKATAPASARLDALLGSDPADLDAAAARRFFEIAGPFERSLVLCGAGQLGKITLAGLRRAGLEPLAFADNNEALAGTPVDGVMVLSPEAAARRWGREATFVVTVYNPSAPQAQLRRAGVERIASYAHLFAAHRDHLLPFMCLGPSADVLAHADEIRAAYDLMVDETSRRELIRQLERRLFIGFDEYRPVAAGYHDREYFPEDVYSPLDDEVFVDCGAYDGDTIRRFLRLRGGRFGKIIAFEPDPASFERLGAFADGLPPEQSRRIRIEPVALSDRKRTIRFDADGSVASSAHPAGTSPIEADALDHLLAGESPSLIKMDLEGAEIEALRGAREIVAASRPILAVCVYHRAEHLWRVPLLIHELTPQYRIFLRAHSEDCWDVSCYAATGHRNTEVQGR